MRRNYILRLIKFAVFTSIMISCTNSFSDDYSANNFITINGIKICYQKYGNAKDSIILIHGFVASSYSWNKIVVALSKKFTVYALDLPGFGYSDRPKDIEYNIDTYAKLVLDFMNSFGIKNAHLAGNSMGGAISLKIVYDNPERVKKLILVDSAGADEKISFHPELLKSFDEKELLKFAKMLIDNDTFIRMVMRMVFYNQILVEDLFDGYAKPLRMEGSAEVMIALIKRFEKWSLKDKLQYINIPTLIIWGENDNIISVGNAEIFNQLIKDSKVVVLKECGHIPMEEKPEEVSKLIIEFCSE